METSEALIETSFEAKFAGHVYIFEGVIKDADDSVNNPGLDSFWIDVSLKRCKNMLQLLEKKDTFQPYSNDMKMIQLVKTFKETICKLERARQDLKSSHSFEKLYS